MSIARKLYLSLLAASVLTTAISIYVIWHQPYFEILVDRSAQAIMATIESQLVRHVTPEMIEERISDRLAEEKRNWLVLEALKEMAEERGIRLSDNLQAEYDMAFEDDHGAWKNVEDCAACLWDAKNCDLSPVLLCQGVAALSPVGDVTGIVRESGHYVSGNPVDEMELILSAVGLTATVAVPLTGGSSWSIKAGAALAKVARRMGLLSPKLMRYVKKSAHDYFSGKVAAKPSLISSTNGLVKSPRADSIKPVMEIFRSFGRMKESAGLLGALHLSRYIDTPGEARRLARISEVEKHRTVGVMELLGKNRALRAAMRYSNEAWALFSGLIGLLTAILGLMFKSIVSIATGNMRKAVRSEKK